MVLIIKGRCANFLQIREHLNWIPGIHELSMGVGYGFNAILITAGRCVVRIDQYILKLLSSECISSNIQRLPIHVRLP